PDHLAGRRHPVVVGAVLGRLLRQAQVQPVDHHQPQPDQEHRARQHQRVAMPGEPADREVRDQADRQGDRGVGQHVHGHLVVPGDLHDRLGAADQQSGCDDEAEFHIAPGAQPAGGHHRQSTGGSGLVETVGPTGSVADGLGVRLGVRLTLLVGWPDADRDGLGVADALGDGVWLEHSGLSWPANRATIARASLRLLAVIPLTTWPTADWVRSETRRSLFSITEYRLTGPKCAFTPRNTATSLPSLPTKYCFWVQA